MGAPNFPTKNISIDNYFTVVLKHMIANKVRLQIEQTKLDEFTNLYGDNTTPDTWAYVSGCYFDVTKRTKVVTTTLRRLNKQMKQVLMDIYANIPVSLWTTEDRSTFERKKGDYKKKYSKAITPISEQCYVSVQNFGGGLVKFRCKTIHDSSRPSLAKGASGVEIAMKIADVELITEKDGSKKVISLTGNWKEPEKAPKKELSTKARFTADIGFENIGRKCEFFARWVNLRRPKLNGPWTGPNHFSVI